MTAIDPGTLKCIGFRTVGRARQAIYDVLRARVGLDNLRELDSETYLIYTEAEPAEIRDWLTKARTGVRWLLVVEFEKWSGYGEIVGEWLLARGH